MENAPAYATRKKFRKKFCVQFPSLYHTDSCTGEYSALQYWGKKFLLSLGLNECFCNIENWDDPELVANSE